MDNRATCWRRKLRFPDLYKIRFQLEQGGHLRIEFPGFICKKAEKIWSFRGQFVVNIPGWGEEVVASLGRAGHSINGDDVREHVGVEALLLQCKNPPRTATIEGQTYQCHIWITKSTFVLRSVHFLSFTDMSFEQKSDAMFETSPHFADYTYRAFVRLLLVCPVARQCSSRFLRKSQRCLRGCKHGDQVLWEQRILFHSECLLQRPRGVRRELVEESSNCWPCFHLGLELKRFS